MNGTLAHSTEAGAPLHSVAQSRWLPGRVRASAGLTLATIGHAGTFLALTAGGLWFFAAGSESLPLVRKIFIMGLYLQALPAFGLAIVSRHLSGVGKSTTAIGASFMSLASFALMGVGTLQLLGPNPIQGVLLGLALLLVIAVGVGGAAARVGHLFRDQEITFESFHVVEEKS